MADHDTPTPIWGHSCLECGRDFTHVPGHPDHLNLCFNCGQQRDQRRAS